MITASQRGPDSLIRKLTTAEQRVRQNGESAVKVEALNLVAYIKEKKLSDVVLRVRTGRLRRSITAKFEGQGSSTFIALVGTNVKYARIHELGFEGTVQVPEHNVKSHSRTMTTAFGKPLPEPRVVNVRAHVVKAFGKHMKMKARPFLAPSLQENLSRIIDNVKKALGKAANV